MQLAQGRVGGRSMQLGPVVPPDPAAVVLRSKQVVREHR